MSGRESDSVEVEARAMQLAPRLVGLSIDAAQALVDEHDGVSVRFTANGIVTADFVPGRIDAYVRDGVVVESVEDLPRVEVRGDAIVLHDTDGPVTWPDADALAAQYWAWQRARRDDDFVACDCLQEATDPLLPEWGDLTRALVDAARDDTELAMAGAGLLEEVLNADPSGVVDELVTRARRDPRYAQALRSVYLGNVPRGVAAKLRPFTG